MEDQSKSKANVVYMVDPNSRQSRKYKKLHLKQKHKQLSQIKTNKTQYNNIYQFSIPCIIQKVLQNQYPSLAIHSYYDTAIFLSPSLICGHNPCFPILDISFKWNLTDYVFYFILQDVLKILFYCQLNNYIYVSTYWQICKYRCPQRPEEETEPPEAELQVIVNQMAWMLELDLESCRSLMLCSLKG